MLTADQAKKLADKVRSGQVPDADLDEAEAMLTEFKSAQPKGETQADLEAKLHTNPEFGGHDPGYPATGKQALEAQNFGGAAEKLHTALPPVVPERKRDPKLATASKIAEPGLSAPPEYTPPTPEPSPSVHPFDNFMAALGKAKDSLPSTFGGKVEHYLEPPRLPNEPLDVYHERADRMWVQKYEDAQAKGIPIVREEFAKIRSPEESLWGNFKDTLGHDIQMGLGSATAGAHYADKALTGGLITKELEKTGAIDEKNLNAVSNRFPESQTVGFIAGALSPRSAGNMVGKALVGDTAKTIIGHALAGAAKGGIAGGVTQGLTELNEDNAPEGGLGRIAGAAGLGAGIGGILGGIGGSAGAHGENLRETNPAYAEAESRGLLKSGPGEPVRDRGLFGGINPREDVARFRAKAVPGSSAEQVATEEMHGPIVETARNFKEGESARVGGSKEKFFAENPQTIQMTEAAKAAANKIGKLTWGESGTPLAGEVNARDVPRLRNFVRSVSSVEPVNAGDATIERVPEEPTLTHEHHGQLQKKALARVALEETATTPAETPTRPENAAGAPSSESPSPSGNVEARVSWQHMTPEQKAAWQKAVDEGTAKHEAGWKLIDETHSMADAEKMLGPKEYQALLKREGLNPNEPQFAEKYRVRLGGPDVSIPEARKLLGDAELRTMLKEQGIDQLPDDALNKGFRLRLGGKAMTPEQHEQILSGLQDPRQGPLQGLPEIQAGAHESRGRFTGKVDETGEPYAKYIEGEHEKLSNLERVYKLAGIPLTDAQGKPGIPKLSELSADQYKTLVNTIAKYGGDLPPAQASAIRETAKAAGQGPQLEALRNNALTSQLEEQMRLHPRWYPPFLVPTTTAGARMRLDPALSELAKVAGTPGGSGALGVPLRKKLSEKSSQDTMDAIARIITGQ
jgi:hypothetical protein